MMVTHRMRVVLALMLLACLCQRAFGFPSVFVRGEEVQEGGEGDEGGQSGDGSHDKNDAERHDRGLLEIGESHERDHEHHKDREHRNGRERGLLVSHCLSGSCRWPRPLEMVDDYLVQCQVRL